MTYFCTEGVFGWTARLARKITMGFCTEIRHECYTLSFILTCRNEKLHLEHLCQSLPEHPVPPPALRRPPTRLTTAAVCHTTVVERPDPRWSTSSYVVRGVFAVPRYMYAQQCSRDTNLMSRATQRLRFRRQQRQPRTLPRTLPRNQTRHRERLEVDAFPCTRRQTKSTSHLWCASSDHNSRSSQQLRRTFGLVLRFLDSPSPSHLVALASAAFTVEMRRSGPRGP